MFWVSAWLRVFLFGVTLGSLLEVTLGFVRVFFVARVVVHVRRRGRLTHFRFLSVCILLARPFLGALTFTSARGSGGPYVPSK